MSVTVGVRVPVCQTFGDDVSGLSPPQPATMAAKATAVTLETAIEVAIRMMLSSAGDWDDTPTSPPNTPALRAARPQ
ncbi:hypothetical protein DI005_30925 [Prauserella sp. PE36]|nr:hypothetical protein DI005_30925 [Prauserella sp. PE36]